MEQNIKYLRFDVAVGFDELWRSGHNAYLLVRAMGVRWGCADSDNRPPLLQGCTNDISQSTAFLSVCLRARDIYK